MYIPKSNTSIFDLHLDLNLKIFWRYSVWDYNQYSLVPLYGLHDINWITWWKEVTELDICGDW